MELKGKHVLILGLGESGLAVARWCDRQGARITVLDSRSAPPAAPALAARVPAATFLSAPLDERFDKRHLQGVDLLVISPGLSPGLLAVIHARAAGIPVVGEIELFAWAVHGGLAGRRPRILAITGTNGKTTTTALTAHLCNSVGLSAIAAGNISPAALDALMEAQDADALPAVWVLELSSFQLETLDSLAPDGATVLNISDDHLDRYIDIGEYASAKARIFQGEGVQVLNREDRRVRRMAGDARTIISFGTDVPGSEDDFGLRENHGEPWLVRGDQFLLPLRDLPIVGLHNAANAMAALALCATLDLPPVSLLPGLRSFRGLAHRVEPVAEWNGVRWFDDSKGTNVGATLAALDGLGPTLGEGRILLILGGDGKGQDFSPLKPAVGRYVRGVALIGRDGAAIGQVLAPVKVAQCPVSTMEEAVAYCHAQARPGDVVLLSPACASLDMYRNYAHRAEVFIAAVKALEGAGT